MDREGWGSRRRSRESTEETFNRDGLWEREFTARAEVWPILEHWTGESGYHLVAAKGMSRRLYAKDNPQGLSVTYLDIRQQDRHVKIFVWIETNIWYRVATCFLVPRAMTLVPEGFWGVRSRRRACRELNELLGRFRQRPISGSLGFHLADVDPTTTALIPLFLGGLWVFAVGAGWTLDLSPGLANPLLEAVARNAGLLGSVAFGLILVHHWAVARRVESLVCRGLSAGAATVLFFLTATVFLSQTTAEMNQSKVAFYCLKRGAETECVRSLEALGTRERERMAARLEALRHQLAVRPK